MRKVLVVLIAALLVPAAAVAKGKPTNPASQSKAAPKVMYVLRGTVTAYSNPGSVTITVTRANRVGKNLTAALNSTSVTLNVAASTKVVLHNGAAVATGDKVVVKVRGPKAIADFMTALNSNSLTAFQVIDQGAPSS
jgi:hypothetical protein